jgi:hypothetical protein
MINGQYLLQATPFVSFIIGFIVMVQLDNKILRQYRQENQERGETI